MINDEEPPSNAKTTGIFGYRRSQRFYNNQILPIPFTRQNLCGAGMQFPDIYNERPICGTHNHKGLDDIINVFSGSMLRNNRSNGIKI
jgi:hypothetical protein